MKKRNVKPLLQLIRMLPRMPLLLQRSLGRLFQLTLNQGIQIVLQIGLKKETIKDLPVQMRRSPTPALIKSLGNSLENYRVMEECTIMQPTYRWNSIIIITEVTPIWAR